MTEFQSLEHHQQAARRYWRQVALSTKPIVKHKAASAVRELYEAATGHPPAYILFFDSPLQAEVASSLFRGGLPGEPINSHLNRPPLSRAVWDGVGIDARGVLPWSVSDEYRRLENPIRSATSEAHVGGLTWDEETRAFETLSAQLPKRERQFLVASEPSYKAWQRAKRLLGRTLIVRQWIAWSAHHSYRRAAGLPRPVVRDSEHLVSAVMGVCEQCGWFWFYPDIAIVADRPSAMRLDDVGRLHSVDDLALTYRDGFSIHAVHGVRVEQGMLEEPNTITVAEIERQTNMEVRRTLLESMGYGRYLSLSGAVQVSRDETGVLWRRTFARPGSGARRTWCFVEVVNGTREPDGSYKRYFLRVPPTMRTAREAVAWTYGLTAETYEPLIRT
jgi:hypothetical protein